MDVIGSIEVCNQQLRRLPHHPPLARTDHALNYVAAGELRLDQGGEVAASKGAILVLPAGTPHQPIDGRDLDIWGVRFCATCFELDETQPLMQVFRRVRLGALPVVVIPEARRGRLLALFGELRREQASSTPETPVLLQSILHLILAEVHRAQPVDPPGKTTLDATTFVADALAFVQQRALTPISLKDVARVVGRSPAHVAATIKKATGHSVGAWIAAARVAQAAARLVHTDASIAEIAVQVGWQDPTHFIRQFRKSYGTTPAAFRRTFQRCHEDLPEAADSPGPSDPMPPNPKP